MMTHTPSSSQRKKENSPSTSGEPSSLDASQPPWVTVSVIILAGGGSTRMGQNKLWLSLGDYPLIEHVTRRICPLASEIIVSANDAQPFAEMQNRLSVPLRVVADTFSGVGPLAGLHAGLSAARSDLALLIAADMPFVIVALGRLLVGLADGFDAVVPLIPSPLIAKPRVPRPLPGELIEQPLYAVYRRTCLPAITARLAARDYQMFDFLADVRTRYVVPAEMSAVDPDLRSFFNVNTPDDWREAQRLLLTD